MKAISLLTNLIAFYEKLTSLGDDRTVVDVYFDLARLSTLFPITSSHAN